MSFNQVEKSIKKILQNRRMITGKALQLQGLGDSSPGSFTDVLSRICILAASSRGGTAITAELLQWQGTDCDNANGRFLTLPGEEKPHLILAGLAYPSRQERFDDLDESDNLSENVSVLLEEIGSEIGFPISFCDNLELYAAQIYRRLLLQWPIQFALIDVEDGILKLTHELKLIFPGGYSDSSINRMLALNACVKCFNFIIPDFYDCWNVHEADYQKLSKGDCWSIEETPFIFPAPWQNAKIDDIQAGTLLLRDPSNAWRIPFWRSVFKKQKLEILHLIRDPRESVQGLCDGWNYRYGFQTMPSFTLLDIAGYTDISNTPEDDWKKVRLNFSICKNLSDKLFIDEEQMTLVEICSLQWKDAHETIIAQSNSFQLNRVVINFSNLRLHTLETFRQICIALNMEQSRSGVNFANSFVDHWVMTTPLAKNSSFDRWKWSVYSSEIKHLYEAGYFDPTLNALGVRITLSSALQNL